MGFIENNDAPIIWFWTPNGSKLSNNLDKMQLHVFYQVCKLLWTHTLKITTTLLLSFLKAMVCWPSTSEPYGLHIKKIVSQ
jgi:hypothetical protein